MRLYRADNGDTGFWTGCMSSLVIEYHLNKNTVYLNKTFKQNSEKCLCVKNLY